MKYSRRGCDYFTASSKKYFFSSCWLQRFPLPVRLCNAYKTVVLFCFCFSSVFTCTILYKSKESMLPQSNQLNFLVLGAGVVGLSTAINACKMWPDALVTVMADKFNEATTSYGAGGIFRPTFDKLPGVPENLLRFVSYDCMINFCLIGCFIKLDGCM